MLSYEFQRLLDAGVVNTRAEIAGRYAISRARVTQIMSLLRLPEEARNHLLSLPADVRECYSERSLRHVVSLSTEEAQMRAFEQLVEQSQIDTCET